MLCARQRAATARLVSRGAPRFASEDLSRRCALAYHRSGSERCGTTARIPGGRTIVFISCVHPDRRGTMSRGGGAATKTRASRGISHAVRAARGAKSVTVDIHCHVYTPAAEALVKDVGEIHVDPL